MGNILQFVGPHRAVQLFGVRLVGVNAENGRKLLFTIGFLFLVIAVGRLLRAVVTLALRTHRTQRVEFWTRQGINVATTALLIVGIISIWFNDPTRLATAAGLVTAGLAFALQKVITSLAGYFVILRGKTFNVGDRITMGGVRGDVINLSFIQTTIMEMGEAPDEQGGDKGMWVRSRQYTGRIVTVTNDKIFDEPVYNFTKDFPYIWEEMHIPVAYDADRAMVEKILLDTARRHTVKITEMSRDALEEFERRYFIKQPDLDPKVYLRLANNWVEFSVRFIAKALGVRELKSQMSRDILDAFEQHGIGISSGTYQLAGPLSVRLESDDKQPISGH